MSEIRDKLASELHEVEWSAIRPHVARDAVILVSPELDLIEVAENVTTDKKSQMAEWVDKGLIVKPTQAELELWETQLQRRFRFLIVSPFVLVQHAAH
jgi:hypothetical protein